MATSTNLSGDYRALYDQAFQEFGALALWNSRRLSTPTTADAIAVARALRVEGNLRARALAERIEAACRAAD
jgi:hypothetical protein